MAFDDDRSHMDEWEADYQALIQDAMERGDIDSRPQTMEKRKHPRIRMLSRQLQVHEPQRFQILDISIGGMSFYSVTPFEVGKVLTVSLEGLLTIEARVLACRMEETDAMFLEVRYKVHCRFEDERYGMRLMVLAMQSEDSSVGIMP